MRTIVFGGSFNPPGIHHREIALLASGKADRVGIVPCGPRPDKGTTNDIEPVHRAAMADLAFGPLGHKIEVDLFDLECSTFTRTADLDARYASQGGEVFHVVGSDWLTGGSRNESLIHRVWHRGPELWRRLHFAVSVREGVSCPAEDLPPNHILLYPKNPGSSEKIRLAASLHQPLGGLVTPEVEAYIIRHGLYRGGAKWSAFKLEGPRLLIVPDRNRPKAVALAEKLRALHDEERPEAVLVLGGDGTMLHAIHDHWRRRIPFIGANFGTIGFLLNEAQDIDPAFLAKTFIVRTSPMLHVETTAPGGVIKTFLAFNDAWMEPDCGGTAWLEASVNGEVRIPRLIGSGLLVATAAGSTASARAMGASPVLIGTELLVVVGSNVSHPFHWRHGANLPIRSVVQFRNIDDSGHRKTFGFADGVPLGEIVSMRVRVSNIAAAALGFVDGSDLERKVTLTQFP